MYDKDFKFKVILIILAIMWVAGTLSKCAEDTKSKQHITIEYRNTTNTETEKQYDSGIVEWRDSQIQPGCYTRNGLPKFYHTDKED